MWVTTSQSPRGGAIAERFQQADGLWLAKCEGAGACGWAVNDGAGLCARLAYVPFSPEAILDFEDACGTTADALGGRRRIRINWKTGNC